MNVFRIKLIYPQVQTVNLLLVTLALWQLVQIYVGDSSEGSKITFTIQDANLVSMHNAVDASFFCNGA